MLRGASHNLQYVSTDYSNSSDSKVNSLVAPKPRSRAAEC